MSFLAPFALITAAVLGPIIVAMYLLKLRRQDRVVSSTFLWHRMVRDVEANAPWQKLRPNLLLLLQLLILLLLVLALARPFFFTQGIAGRNLILIVDRSASMGATDIQPSRLEEAKNQANTLVSQLEDGGRATIIAAGGQMEVLASSTTDRRELRQAIRAIVLRNGGGSDLAQPLTLAAALAAREAQSEIAIISDGNVTLPENLKMPVPVRYFPIGQSSDNVAINALTIQRSAGGQTLFAQAVNYGDTPVTRRMDILLDGSLFNAYHLSLNPGREQSIVAEIPAEISTAEAMLDGHDSLPLDDHAWAVSTVQQATGVRIVGAGNHFLETGLSLLPGIHIIKEPPTWSPEQTTSSPTNVPVVVTILDSVIPSPLPSGNLLFIRPPRSTEFFSVTGEIEFPSVQPAPGDEPLLRNISLSEVNVMKAARIVPSNWFHVVAYGNDVPLLVTGERHGRRIVVLSFDLHESDMPLQVAFPLLLSNVMSFLAPGSGAEASQLIPDQPLVLPIDPDITEVRLTRPDGTQISTKGGPFPFQSKERLTIQDNQLVYANTDMLGLYTVEGFKDEKVQLRRQYAANLFTSQESLIKPRQNLAIVQSSGLQSAITSDRAGKQEIWRWLAMIALVILVIEWLIYHKNGFIVLRQRWKQ